MFLLTLLLIQCRAAHGQDDTFLEVATSKTDDKVLLAALSKTPFAWVSVKEEENKKTTVTLEKLGARDASKYLTMRKRGTDRMGRQNTFSSPNKPLLKFDPKSPESVLIAQKIDALFESGETSLTSSLPLTSQSDVLPNTPTINSINMTVGGLTNQMNRPQNQGSTPFQLSINLNIQLENGQPSRVRVPQGELMLLYLPQIRNPNGGAAVELSHNQLQRILAETSQPTSMVMLPTGGLLLMSLAPYTDTDTGYRVTSRPQTQKAGPSLDLQPQDLDNLQRPFHNAAAQNYRASDPIKRFGSEISNIKGVPSLAQETQHHPLTHSGVQGVLSKESLQGPHIQDLNMVALQQQQQVLVKPLKPLARLKSSSTKATTTTTTKTTTKVVPTFWFNTTKTPTTTRPTPSTTTLSPRQQMVDHVMHMDPPELVDALMEPMMMVVGTMVALSGAYMAIVIDELAASNALALAAAGLGGKK